MIDFLAKAFKKLCAFSSWLIQIAVPVIFWFCSEDIYYALSGTIDTFVKADIPVIVYRIIIVLLAAFAAFIFNVLVFGAIAQILSICEKVEEISHKVNALDTHFSELESSAKTGKQRKPNVQVEHEIEA